MQLYINGDIKEYYVQTLCLLFFPGSKFSLNPEDDHKIYVDALVDDESCTVTVKFDIKGLIIEKSHSEKINLDTKDVKDALKQACGKAFLACGKSYNGTTPQWGILTGVRPSKIAIKMLNDGYNKTETKSFLSKSYFLNSKKSSLVTDIAATEKKIISKLPPKSCSLYISIPYCPSKCSYCSFVSFASTKSLATIDDYLVQLSKEISKTIEFIKNRNINISTIYIGGGTPTTLNEKQLNKLLSFINKQIDISELEEFTVEAGRPDTITVDKLKILKNYNVERISINPQTLNGEVLEIIGRKHTIEDFYNAYNIANKIGFKDINTDLIAGLPYDGFNSFSETIETIIKLDPTNVTVHTLCIKNAADFAQNREQISNQNNDVSKSVDYSQLSLKNAGYIPYYIYRQKNTIGNLENVGYSKPGHECRYNIYMMEETHTIFGCGAGAVSKFVSQDRTRIERSFDFKYPNEYLQDISLNKIDKKLQYFDELYKNDANYTELG